jgi:hypothetical protein
VILHGDKLKFHSYEPVDDPQYAKDVRIYSVSLKLFVKRYRIMCLSFTEKMELLMKMIKILVSHYTYKTLVQNSSKSKY